VGSIFFNSSNELAVGSNPTSSVTTRMAPTDSVPSECIHCIPLTLP
jgi:hypothetical protein